MILKELRKLLEKIVKTHPEADDSVVFGQSIEKDVKFQVENVGYSTRLKKPRILLED
jgi:hypothetical protein